MSVTGARHDPRPFPSLLAKYVGDWSLSSSDSVQGQTVKRGVVVPPCLLVIHSHDILAKVDHQEWELATKGEKVRQKTTTQKVKLDVTRRFENVVPGVKTAVQQETG